VRVDDREAVVVVMAPEHQELIMGGSLERAMKVGRYADS
jgi:hypothetical protein